MLFRTVIGSSSSRVLLKLPRGTLQHQIRCASGLRVDENGKRNVIVQKFGGTSLGTAEKMEKVVNIIKKFKEDSEVVAVVSALSSDTKAEGTTSRLLTAAQCAVKQEDFGHYLDRIEDTHLDVIYGLLKSREMREEVRAFVSDELHEIRQFCSSLSVIRELSNRSHDKIIGCGERLAAGLVSGILRDEGYDSVYVNLSKAFGGLNTSKRGYQVVAKQVIKSHLEDLVNAGKIPVVTGFFGEVNNGIINGVGRGYTDLTSALCAGALDAKALQVWKESDGVFTGNPTKIDDARLLSLVTPQEAAELTYFGNEVLHPFTMECAIADEVPIHILNTFKPDSGGTAILDSKLQPSPDLLKARGGRHGIIAVCSKKDINVINLMSNRLLDSSSFLRKVFELFDAHKVKADLVSTSVSNISVTIHETVSMTNIKALMVDLESYGDVNLQTDRAIVSCIGSGMAHQVGLAAKVFQCLSDAGISLEMISQGSSEINMSVVIPASDMDTAIKAIHSNYLADPAA